MTEMAHEFCRLSLGWSFEFTLGVVLGVSAVFALWLRFWQSRLAPGLGRWAALQMPGAARPPCPPALPAALDAPCCPQPAAAACALLLSVRAAPAPNKEPHPQTFLARWTLQGAGSAPHRGRKLRGPQALLPRHRRHLHDSHQFQHLVALQLQGAAPLPSPPSLPPSLPPSPRCFLLCAGVAPQRGLFSWAPFCPSLACLLGGARLLRARPGSRQACVRLGAVCSFC